MHAAVLVLAGLTSLIPLGASAAEFEVGEVEVASTTDGADTPKVWETVNVEGSYTDPVVIASPVTHDNDLPLSARVKDVKSNQFQIGMESACESTGNSNLQSGDCPPSGGWSAETIRYLVIEEGSWEFPDGTKIEAHKRSVKSLRRNEDGSRDKGVKVDYDHIYEQRPVFLHQVMSNDTYTAKQDAWVTSSVWSNEQGRDTPPQSGTAKLALEGASAQQSELEGTETVGWVAIERASGSFNGKDYVADYTDSAKVVRHADGKADDCTQLSWSGFSSKPDAVASMNTVEDDDGGWNRLCKDGIEQDGLNLHIAEDTTQDAERDGSAEYAGWFAFSARETGTLEPFQPSSPGLVGSMNSVEDDDGGWLRGCGANSEPDELVAEVAEDQTQNAERDGSEEYGAFLGFETNQTGTLEDPNSNATANFEMGRVELESTTDSENDGPKVWEKLKESDQLEGDYTNPVVIAGPVTHANERALSARIRKLKSDSFEIGMQSPCEATGDSNVAEGNCPPSEWVQDSVPYLVVEEGTWVFPDGTRIEVHNESIDALRSKSTPNASATVSLDDASAFDERPVIIHQVVSAGSGDKFKWVTTSTWRKGARGQPPKPKKDSGEFELAVEGAGAMTDPSNIGSRKVAWVAIEPGQGANDSTQYAAGNTDQPTFPRHDSGECGSAGEFDFTGPHHWAISHSGTAASCAREDVTITGHTADHTPIDAQDGELELSTSTGEGTWARVLTGLGTLLDNTEGDGAGSYTFPDNGEKEVELAFNYTKVVGEGTTETVDFNIEDDRGKTEDRTDEVDEDPNLTVAHSELRITHNNDQLEDVPDQIAAKPSDREPGSQNLALQAIETSDPPDSSECEPLFEDGETVKVELAGECKDPSTCDTEELKVTNDGTTTSVDTSDDNGDTGAASYEPVDLLFGANAQAPIILEYAEAGALQLHVQVNPIREKDDSSEDPVVEYVTGASNDFVVRPFGFQVEVPGDTGGTGPTGAIMTTAGKDFEVTVTARGWQDGDDSDTDGLPDDGVDLSTNPVTENFGQEENFSEKATLSPTVAAPSVGVNGSLTNATFSDFSDGSSTISNISWSEVGYVDLDAALASSPYMGWSASYSGDVTGQASMNGRFIPDHFAFSDSDDGLDNRADLTACTAPPFTYIGERFDGLFVLTAENATGSRTKNYRDDYARLDSDQLDMGGVDTDPDPDEGLTDPLNVDSVDISSWSDIGTGSGAGSADIDVQLSLDRTDDDTQPSDQGPFEEFRLGTAPEDDDAVEVASFDLDVDVDNTDDHRQVGADTELRFGRLLVENANGSEIDSIDQPVRAEYWSGDTWQTNSLDECTELTLSNEVQLDSETDSSSGDNPITVDSDTTEITNGPISLSSGTAVAEFQQMTEGNTGWVDTTAILGSQDHPYLRTDPDDDDVWDTDPTGRVTFGVFRGNSNWIHLRRVR